MLFLVGWERRMLMLDKELLEVVPFISENLDKILFILNIVEI